MRLLLLQQPVQNSRVSARHVEYLRPARLPRHKRDRLAADTKRRSDRSQRCRCRLAIDGTGADPNDQRAVVLAAHARMCGAGLDPDGDSHEPSVPGRRRTGPVSPEGPSRSHLPTGRAGQAGSCRHGRAVRMQRRRALRPPRPSNQSCSLATSRAGITLSDGTTKKERTPTRRYLKSVWGVSDVAIRAFELRRRQCYLKPCVRRSRRGVTHVTCAYPFSLMLFGLASARRALVSDMSTTQNRPLTWASPKWTSDNRLMRANSVRRLAACRRP